MTATAAEAAAATAKLFKCAQEPRAHILYEYIFLTAEFNKFAVSVYNFYKFCNY